MIKPHELTPEEATAVYRAAEAMREFRDRYEAVRKGSRNGRRFRTGGRGSRDPSNPAPNPSAPIEELRKRGKIDGLRDTKLTALAYRMSFDGDVDSGGAVG